MNEVQLLPQEVWNVIAAISITGILLISISVNARLRRYPECRYCGGRHPERGHEQTTLEFMRTYCGS